MDKDKLRPCEFQMNGDKGPEWLNGWFLGLTHGDFGGLLLVEDETGHVIDCA